MIYTNHWVSPLGGIALASNGTAITGLWFDGQKYFGDTLPKEHEAGALPVFEQAKRWLAVYFGGEAPTLLRLSFWMPAPLSAGWCGKFCSPSLMGRR